MSTGAGEQRLRFREATVRVREVGEGPPLLMINGLGAHHAMWGALEGVLSGFRLLELDLPGAGREDVPWRPVPVRSLARVAARVLDHYGIERADVLGYSMGGIVAQQLAHDAPQRVRRMALVATTPGVGALQGDLTALFNIITPVRYLSAGAYEKTIGSLVGGRARHDTAFVREQSALRRRHAPTWRGYLGQLSSISRWSSLPFLHRLTPPTLVVAGDDDPLTPLANATMLAHLLPQARLLVCRGEGHLIPLDPLSVAHAVLRDFLTADDLAGSPAWQGAATVSADDVAAALEAAGTQVPPWSIANARMRRRHLDLPDPADLPARAAARA